MADVTTYLDNSVPDMGGQSQVISKTISLPASGISQNDNIQVFTVPQGVKWRITNTKVRTSATLGAGATLTAQINRAGARTALSAATTAGAASKVSSAATVGAPFDAVGGDIIELLLGGANLGGAATVDVEIEYYFRQV